MLFYLFGENLILEKDLESPLILIFLKGKNKIRKKKTLSVIPKGKTGLWKTKSGSEGQVTNWVSSS